MLGSTLVIAVPGSRGGATESLAAIEPLLDHALETLGGHTQHAGQLGGERRRADVPLYPLAPALFVRRGGRSSRC